MRRAGATWSVTIPASPGTRYGYRAAGPSHDPAKLLVDPCAVELNRRFRYDPALGTPGAETAALVPRAIVQAPGLPVTAAPLPVAGGLVYEVNVSSFTRLHPDVPPAQRGTVAALAQPAVLAHLCKLRVTAVELMPIVAWIDERHLPPLGLRNAWGYNPVVPMALDPGLCPGGVAELRATVAALHAAGIAVILDLVFNHTGESDRAGPTLSLRGLDDAVYARTADGALINDTGTGNTLDFARGEVRALTLATLRHFAALGVDGFRFDLATVLARGPGFDPAAPIFAEIAADPLLAGRTMIAEPWDIGPGGYRLGAFPADWLEWNDRYRDDVRRFWRGDRSAGALAMRLAGSSDVFGEARTRSVSFVAAHDGFTLADTARFAAKRNWANGEENRDGHGHEVSWEGSPEDVQAMLACLFATRGTIMLTAGDEFGRTQGGNNNAYAQNNATIWLDWENRDVALEEYVAGLARWRAAHPAVSNPAMRHDLEWRTLDGWAMEADDWAGADGFELMIPGAPGVTVRVDRARKRVELGS